jgi:nucleoside-diphosphate kinase
MMQRTVVLVKPDGLQRGLVGQIVSRFETKGLKLVGIKMVKMTDAVIEDWYIHLKDKSFFGEIKSYIAWTPIVAMVWEGLEAIPAVRKIVGITKAREAEAGSIRGDFGMSGSQNLIHASDSEEAAKKEIGLVFKEDELFDYQSAMDALVYSKEDLG